MTGLLDIAPLTETVEVRGQKIEVGELSGSAIVRLIARFPELRTLMTGRAIEPGRLLEIGGDALDAVIAAACGYSGDADAEKAAGRLGAETQAEILEVTLRLSMPNGVGPFAERLHKLAGSLGGDGQPPKAPATKSRKPSRN